MGFKLHFEPNGRRVTELQVGDYFRIGREANTDKVDLQITCFRGEHRLYINGESATGLHFSPMTDAKDLAILLADILTPALDGRGLAIEAISRDLALLHVISPEELRVRRRT
ncbi:MAG: hypothetical protein WCV84_04870 [Patescibacteria group bacterium]